MSPELSAAAKSPSPAPERVAGLFVAEKRSQRAEARRF